MRRAERGDARCGACGARYSALAWTELACVRVVSGAEVATYAVGWPRERSVEVRACAACGGTIARVRAEVAA